LDTLGKGIYVIGILYLSIISFYGKLKIFVWLRNIGIFKEQDFIGKNV